jgi:hypothetical protein
MPSNTSATGRETCARKGTSPLRSQWRSLLWNVTLSHAPSWSSFRA